MVNKKIISKITIDFFQQFLSEGDLAIDIGANIGQMTIQMALCTGVKGLTLGFDPNPYVYEILEENLKLNPEKTNIVAYNLAITEQDEENLYYHSSEASFNNGGISTTPNSKHGKFSLNTQIKGVNLESFLAKHHPDFVNKLKLIKIDTEGYDKEIIKSIINLLRKYKPVVITECFAKNTNEERFEQYELLKSIGYSLYYVADFSSDAEVVPINTKEDMLKWKHFDLYAK
ncbi:MAG: FkbM family methyltransferase [Thermoflexibacteraceae bacterium]